MALCPSMCAISLGTWRTGCEKKCFYKAKRLCLSIFKLYFLEVLISCLILLLIILFQDMNSINPIRSLYEKSCFAFLIPVFYDN